jgi:hypothetical protein
MNNNLKNTFFIVNEYDRPYERLIAWKDKTTNLFYYIHPELLKTYSYPTHGLQADFATPLENFGIELYVMKMYGNILCGELSNASIATYLKSKKTRFWQGNTTFNIHLPSFIKLEL